MSELNASQTILLALEELFTAIVTGDPFPMVRFSFAETNIDHQTLNRELDRNVYRNDLVAQGRNTMVDHYGETEEMLSLFGSVVWTPSISKSATGPGRWIMTAGVAAIVGASPDGIRSQAVARYAKQGFGKPRIFWRGADGIVSAVLPAAL